MNFNIFDVCLVALFLGFIFYLTFKSFYSKQSTSSYFRAGGKIHWSVIGFSLIAADVGLSYIIGGAGVAYEKGIAVGSYGWTGSIAMIIVALYILPRLMALEILTIPEYLERRFHPILRLIVAGLIIIIHTIDGLSITFYTGAVLIQELFQLNEFWFRPLIWGTGFIACLLIVSGGLYNMLRTQFLIVSLMLIAGIIVLTFCFIEVGGFESFMNSAGDKMHAILPADDKMLPWTQVFFGGLWVLHLYYWAFNQHITQSMLASDSLSQAQKGILLAATIKIFIPFLFTLPGIIGYELFKDQISNADRIFPVILREIVPVGIKGFIMIAFVSTVIGSSNALLHACSTILTFDIYKRFINKNAEEKKLITVSRIGVVVFVLAACLLAPNLNNLEHLFQNSQYISSALAPVLAAIFLFGLYSKRTSGKVALIALFVSTPIYIILLKTTDYSTLTLAGINFLITAFVLYILTLIKPLPLPMILEEKKAVRFERNLGVFIWFVFILTMVIFVYVVFS